MKFSLRIKLGIILALPVLIAVVLGVFFLGSLISNTDESFKFITNSEIPKARAIQQSLLALHESGSALGFVLGVDRFEKLDRIREYESIFNQNTFKFEMFNAAMLYGSESPEFKNFQAGIIYQEWVRLGYNKTYLVPKVGDSEFATVKEAGEVFRIYVEKSQNLISAKRKILRAIETSNGDAKTLSEELDHTFLEIEALRLRVGELSEKSISEYDKVVAIQMENYAKSYALIVKTMIVLTVFLVLMMTTVGLVLSNILVVRPIKKLTQTATDISKGKLDTKIDSSVLELQDEIGSLARSFDRTLVSLKLAMKMTNPPKSTP